MKVLEIFQITHSRTPGPLFQQSFQQSFQHRPFPSSVHFFLFTTSSNPQTAPLPQLPWLAWLNGLTWSGLTPFNLQSSVQLIQRSASGQNQPSPIFQSSQGPPPTARRT
jgi:hypothetical protein